MTINNKEEYTHQEKEFLKINPNYFEPLDDEERQLMEDLENGLYSEVKEPTEEELKKYKEFAKNTINILKKEKKNKLLTLRVNGSVIDDIKNQAFKFGINYQTYINMFLYQLAKGTYKLKFD